MKFCELFNEYIDTLNCSNKEISYLSGISPSVISRYRNGEREPQTDSDILTALSKALSEIAAAKNIENMSEEIILSAFKNVLLSKSKNYEKFLRNFNILYDELNLNMKDISAFTNFDTSFLYRIKSGERKTSDVSAFCDNISKYIVSSYSSFEDKEKLADLLSISYKDISDARSYRAAVYKWLNADNSKTDNSFQNKKNPEVIFLNFW